MFIFMSVVVTVWGLWECLLCSGQYNEFFYHIKPQTIRMSAIHSQSSSDALIVKSGNIEGLTANQASILSELCNDKHCHCLCLQNIHRDKHQTRPSIPGMALVAERPHSKHGNSVFVRDGLKINSISVCEEDIVEFITVELPGVVVQTTS